jgi:hypothetical protein
VPAPGDWYLAYMADHRRVRKIAVFQAWLLDAVPMVPPALWRHLGSQFAIAAPDLASLRALYGVRRR